MNKYRAESKAAQNRLRRERMCERKIAFAIEADAAANGQRVYRCPFCGFFHRSASLAKLAARVRRPS